VDNNLKEEASMSYYLSMISSNITKTQNYTILTSDNIGTYIFNPNVAGGSGQYGTLIATLPVGSLAVIGVPYKIIHGSNSGLVKILCQGSDKINFKGMQTASFLLYNPGNQIECIWNGTDYSIKVNTSIRFWQGRSTCNQLHIGNGFTYDTKSAGVNLTGMVLTEETSGNTALCLFDSGGTGNSGILYYANMTGTNMIWTNNKTITASSGTTCLVNEPTGGSSKNIDYDIFHGQGIDINLIARQAMRYNTSAALAGSFDLIKDGLYYGSGDYRGYDYIEIDTNYIRCQCFVGVQLLYFPDSGSVALTGDGFFFQQLDFIC
jgi:hypothetical protein